MRVAAMARAARDLFRAVEGVGANPANHFVLFGGDYLSILIVSPEIAFHMKIKTLQSGSRDERLITVRTSCRKLTVVLCHERIVQAHDGSSDFRVRPTCAK